MFLSSQKRPDDTEVNIFFKTSFFCCCAFRPIFRTIVALQRGECMKKSFFAAMMALTASIFADPALSAIPETQAPSQLFETSSPPKQGFLYVRFAAGENDMAQAAPLAPGLGLGYRRLVGDGAADISFSGIGISEHSNSQYFWAAPKVSYYHFLQPNATRSLYAGGGLAWGGVRVEGEAEKVTNPLDGTEELHSTYKRFTGIMPSATLGYEFNRNSSILAFTEITLTQPALAVERQGKFPGPMAELSVGVGF
jgi:hypothetical protein